ncbi:MAG: CPBP family intramembrane glutamic endopeptidase [Candidatus Izemoplasmatales bacterium]|jgi:membrane protease YdiL (CAAX protease family)
MANLIKHKKILIILTSLFILVILASQFLRLTFFTDDLTKKMANDISIRLGMGLIFLFMMYYMGYCLFKKPGKSWIQLLFVLIPGLLISINNFPISAYLSSRTTLTEPIHTVFFYAVECLAIGFFEETVFRGVILLVLLQRLPQTKRGSFMAIIVSSALFGLTHLFNLFVGAAVPDTLIQVGYSFLMGAMWSVIYIATENLLFPILLHASYNFFGEVLFRLGTVSNRFDFPTILVTSILAVLAIMAYSLVFCKIKQEDLANIGASDSR